ncbi:sigma factor-like helix-turn-helix DNA-binding protein [Streptomyces sp. ID05-39B]|uniref:sigma factor-like helix-turn-helix DNA-binding protein n=1 Tax=Streptomyces sp. ID05-39B TaxID=3028664 RepID=UPI0029B13835|nr:sigma factor-like helix-turn-helix DNA-binding protein [Streptomyces sp. ID05-39B]MDX3526818.1 sigma factor-like helix-turn-helix DNA-binding protein [Streptomyces sp. ID05-39B]
MPPTPDVLPVLPTAGHDFATYSRTHWSRLVVTARLLTDDPGAAEELARRTLVRMGARWRRVPRNDVDFHVRRCLVRNHLRRPRGRRAARRWAVVVLRVWEGLADAEIAQLLGCSVGAVRAHARHGLKKAGTDPGQLREVFTRAARDIVPGEVPLTDLQAGGRLRRRRRLAVASAACAALLTPVALLAADRLGGGGAQDGTSGARPANGSRQATSPVRVVAPGERVTAGTGVRMWLTADGGHWSVPLPGDDSDRPLDEPGVSLRVDSVNGGFFLSGLFHGLSGDPGRVEVRTGDGGRTTAKVLVLAGSPGWGIWYASTPLHRKNVQALLSVGGDDRIVTVYDASGRVAARSDLEWWRI